MYIIQNIQSVYSGLTPAIGVLFPQFLNFYKSGGQQTDASLSLAASHMHLIVRSIGRFGGVGAGLTISFCGMDLRETSHCIFKKTGDRISLVGWGRVYRDCLWVLKMVGEPAPTVIGVN
jgi:hypothetical protein